MTDDDPTQILFSTALTGLVGSIMAQSGVLSKIHQRVRLALALSVSPCRHDEIDAEVVHIIQARA